MAEVSPVFGPSNTHAPVQAGSSQNTKADYDTFLTLLVTQLRNQDPTKPTDNSELIAQLASFSSVEQQTQTNSKLDQLLAVMSLDQGASLIGKYLQSADGSTKGVVTSITLDGNGSVATLESGKKVSLGPGVTISANSR